MKTIRIVSADPASQGPFVTINADDFVIGQHEPFGEEDLEVLRGAPFVYADAIPGNVLSPDPLAQLRAELEAENERVRADLAKFRDDLVAEGERLRVAGEQQAIEAKRQGDELTAERTRLEALAKSLEQAAKQDLGATTGGTIAPDPVAPRGKQKQA